MPQSGFELTTSRSPWRQHDQGVLLANHSATAAVINHISRYLPTTTKERVINALITSRIDYCNSLLNNTSANNISRLQRMHNAAARLILCRPRTDRATPLLRKLHWLPVACRIQYKILLFSYKITHRHVPFYLRDLLPSYQIKYFYLKSVFQTKNVSPRLILLT